MSTTIARRSSIVVLTGAAATALTTCDIRRVAVTIQGDGAGTRALRIVDISNSAGSAVSCSAVVDRARSACWTAPLIAAAASAAFNLVTRHTESVTATVRLDIASRIAARIGGELSIASSTRCTILGVVIPDRALVANGAVPLSSASAAAVGQEP